MPKKHSDVIKARIKRKIALIIASIGGIGLLATLSVSLFFIMTENDSETTTQQPEHPTLEATPNDGRAYPTAHVGMDNQFFEYRITRTETEYEERQAVLDEGYVTLWPDFTESGILWLSAHYPGTFSYIGDNIRIGSTIEVTTPKEYNQRSLYDDPDVLRFEIVERLETDIWAMDTFETTGLMATEMYNNGVDESTLVLQHSGEEEDDVILYLGEFIEKEAGERVSEMESE